MVKKIVINLLLILAVFSLTEFYCYTLTNNDNIRFKEKADSITSGKKSNFKTEYKIFEPFKPVIFRKSFIKSKSKKKPIIWFGCSFAEGAGLSDTQCPCYKISQLTQRSCINKSKGATGPQFMYYQLNTDKLKEEVPEADYVIYTYIKDHIRRLYNYQLNPLIYMFNQRYKLKDGQLVEIKPVFAPVYSLYSVRRIQNTIVEKNTKEEELWFTLFNAIMKESAKTVKEKYPNAKFIMIEFPECNQPPDSVLPDYEIKELESYGITVIRVKDLKGTQDLNNPKYWLTDEIHPSERAWNIILPQITARL